MKIAVIGLGYVGMPLAVEFSKKYPVVGFDINEARVKELQGGSDRTREIDSSSLKEVLSLSDTNHAIGLKLSHDIEALHDCNFFIVTVPTPITKFKTPDLKPLLGASSTVGKVLKKGDIVVYESTVYPGCTEEDCVPVLEKESGLKFNQDFFCGYSPERINPGDKKNTLTTIKKVVSGSTPEIADRINELYSSIIKAGTFKASCIKVAEACKAIENAQRDVNISFMNELALIFDKMGIDTQEVLDAAATKWNFLKFAPGLVGGHCIGVDPYYLAQKAQEYGYHPEIILAGRRLNDSMGEYVAKQTLKCMIRKGQCIKGSKVLVLGITFKENCPDVRNTKVVDIIAALKEFDLEVDVYDPWASPEEVRKVYGLEMKNTLPAEKYEAVVLAVAHQEFRSLRLRELCKENGIVYDVKSVAGEAVEGRL